VKRVLTLRERLEVDHDTTGKGVTMAFVDSAFVPHPDLTRPVDRIRAFVDLTQDAPTPEDFLRTDPHVWHGTMTACSAAGAGYLSQGRYKGIAYDADVVLLKVQASARASIAGRHVAAALRFVREHPELEVRVVNVSVGVPWDDPDALSVERAASDLVQAGVVVVAAVGNVEGATPSPPASVAEVLAVGGIDDRNTQSLSDDGRFPSNAGARSQRVIKPDLLAPAAELPAPMVPGTLTAREAPMLLQTLQLLEEAEAEARMRNGRPLDPQARSEGSLLRTLEALRERIEVQKFISPAYQHVDGTSFAAPIVSAVVAQMLEAAPRLSPDEVRRGLVETARKLPELPALLQGAGVIEPRRAVEWARQRALNRSVTDTGR
jgi:serine protease AprX